jgi:hypothetical protein
MQRNVVSFVALDLVLRVIFGRMMRITFVVQILCVNFDDPTADVSGFRVPGHMIIEFEFLHHSNRSVRALTLSSENRSLPLWRSA